MSVRQLEQSELRPTRYFSDWSDFFQCCVINLPKGFGQIDLKPTWIEYIWVGVVHLPSKAASDRPFVFERDQNLGPHSISMSWIMMFFFLSFLSWTSPKPSQRYVLVTSRSYQGHVKATSRLHQYHVDDNTIFKVGDNKESCLFTRKPLLIDVLSFLDLYYIDLSWFAFVYAPPDLSQRGISFFFLVRPSA